MGEGSSIAVSCAVGHRRSSGPALLWLWRRLAAVAPITPLSREPPYAAGAALKRPKKKKKVLDIVPCAIQQEPIAYPFQRQ